MPSDRTSTGSPITSVWNVTGPRTTSSKVTSRLAGTRSLTTAFSPAATRACASPGAIARHVPAYLGGSPAAASPAARPPACRRSRSSNRRRRDCDQLASMIGVEREPLGLTIRSIIAAAIDAFVPLQPHPLQVVLDGLLGLARRSLEVGVFDAEDERAAAVPCEQPVEERCSRVADMEVTGWGRGKSDTHQYQPQTSVAHA